MSTVPTEVSAMATLAPLPDPVVSWPLQVEVPPVVRSAPERATLHTRPCSKAKRTSGLLLRAALVSAVLGLAAMLAPLLAGWQVYAVEGGSMEPTIPLGSLITVRPVNQEDLQVGDVITFVDSAHRRARITHRVSQINVSEGHQVINTKGDANTVEDVWDTPTHQPIGRVVYFVPLGGYLVFYLGTIQAKLALLAAIALLLIYQTAAGRGGVRQAPDVTRAHSAALSS